MRKMQKSLTVLLSLILLLSLVSPAAAADKVNPFAPPAPEHVSVRWMETNDSPTSCSFSYSVPTVMSDFQKAFDDAEDKEAFLAPYGLDDAWFTLQIDWALDDVNDPVSGWHYNKYWDGDSYHGLGKDSDAKLHCSDWDGTDCGIGNITETVNDVPNDDRLNGNPETGLIGVKDQLRPDQFTYDYENEWLKIDFTKHTVYVRARFVFVVRKPGVEGEQYYFSPWSDTASCGKDAASYTVIKPGDIAAPEITDLHMTDKEFNGNPVVAFTLTVPDALAKMGVDASAHGGYIYIETEARVKGDTEWVNMSNTDRDIKPGEMECALLSLLSDEHPSIDKNTPIELRCRYRCDQEGVDEDVFSEYSKVLTFETTEIGNDLLPTPTAGADAEEPNSTTENKKDDKCPICHFCPQPLGLCIFIWLLIIIVIVVIVIVIIKATKKDKDQKENKPQDGTGADRSAGAGRGNSWADALEKAIQAIEQDK